MEKGKVAVEEGRAIEYSSGSGRLGEKWDGTLLPGSILGSLNCYEHRLLASFFLSVSVLPLPLRFITASHHRPHLSDSQIQGA